MDDIRPSDLARGRRLKAGAIAAPVILTLLPAIITLLLLFLAASGPPAAAVILFVGIIATVIGFVAGITITAILAKKASAWTREMKERIAADGIKAEEISWFRN